MSFYLQPPGGNISLQKLTQYAETRLKFLCQVYLTNGDRLKLHDIVLATEAVEDSDCLIGGSVKDKISHFILRLAFAENKQMRNFLLAAETMLFDFRFSSMSRDELQKCFRALDHHINSIESFTNTHVRQILVLLKSIKSQFHGWRRLIHKYLSGDSDDGFQVPFQTVLQLVSQRDVLLNKGIASVPVCRLRQLVTSLFSQMLEAGIQEAEQSLQAPERDGRIYKLHTVLRNIYYQTVGRYCQPITVPWSLTHTDVDTHVQLFPPCMSELHRTLRQQHRLNHHARIQYTLFLKEAGLPVHEALMFWRAEYSQPPTNRGGCCHKWVENESRYTYNIRHLYGLEGSMINYRGHSCKALQEMHVGANCEGGCPFNLYDSSHVYNMMKTDGIEDRHLEVLDLTSQGKYTQACELHLALKLKKECKSVKNEHTSNTIANFDVTPHKALSYGLEDSADSAIDLSPVLPCVCGEKLQNYSQNVFKTQSESNTVEWSDPEDEMIEEPVFCLAKSEHVSQSNTIGFKSDNHCSLEMDTSTTTDCKVNQGLSNIKRAHVDALNVSASFKRSRHDENVVSGTDKDVSISCIASRVDENVVNDTGFKDNRNKDVPEEFVSISKISISKPVEYYLIMHKHTM